MAELRVASCGIVGCSKSRKHAAEEQKGQRARSDEWRRAAEAGGLRWHRVSCLSLSSAFSPGSRLVALAFCPVLVVLVVDSCGFQAPGTHYGTGGPIRTYAGSHCPIGNIMAAEEGEARKWERAWIEEWVARELKAGQSCARASRPPDRVKTCPGAAQGTGADGTLLTKIRYGAFPSGYDSQQLTGCGQALPCSLIGDACWRRQLVQVVWYLSYLVQSHRRRGLEQGLRATLDRGGSGKG
ncbi:hypothetical protein B0T17DRAFT_601668 [Bombardia bombarda]|uniref:Uncharacterized protein n=1 Tax=Bombardia bombarda TaxID=252184 RepID=A0AA39WHY7_9PEZI|nr:hypothetical protein B0T17DRAFT_601668 [Bombardia bombarda]